MSAKMQRIVHLVQSSTHSHACTPTLTRMYTHTRARMHRHTRARTDTKKQYTSINSLGYIQICQQQCFVSAHSVSHTHTIRIVTRNLPSIGGCGECEEIEFKIRNDSVHSSLSVRDGQLNVITM